MNKRLGFVVFLILGCFLVTAYADTPSPPTSNHIIRVTGEAQVRVTPDLVIIRIGVDSQDQQLAEAKRQNDEIVKRLLKSVRELGVKEDQIQTSFIEIEPRNRVDRNSGKTHFVGYYVNNRIAVTLKDLAKFEQLLSGILQAGANRVYGIDFRTSELKKHRDKARRMAVKAALDKATTLAGELGRKVGRPLTILEQTEGTNYPYRMRDAGYPQQVRVEQASPDSISSEGIALGKIGINARVDVTFELD